MRINREKFIKTAVASLGAIAILSPTVAIADRYIDSVRRQLIGIGIQVLGGNYRLTHDPLVDKLDDNQYTYHNLTLYAGVDQNIIAVCDQDCSDVDLWLYDANGNLIDKDTSSDDYPVVSVVPKWTGRFKVKVKMYDCDASYCNYGIGVFGR